MDELLVMTIYRSLQLEKWIAKKNQVPTTGGDLSFLQTCRILPGDRSAGGTGTVEEDGDSVPDLVVVSVLKVLG
jgi:hypothetical protein